MKIEELILKNCYKEGNFILHSGQNSDHIYDILELIMNEEFTIKLSKFVENDHLVGIEFGGSLFAAIRSYEFSIVRKDGTVYGKIPDNYVLFDDVVTTENSIRTAIKQIGKEPTKIKCIVDRREIKTLNIESMYQSHLGCDF